MPILSRNYAASGSYGSVKLTQEMNQHSDWAAVAGTQASISSPAFSSEDRDPEAGLWPEQGTHEALPKNSVLKTNNILVL